MSQRIEERFVRDPEGDPKSRLWVAVVERAHGCANGETRRRTVVKSAVPQCNQPNGGDVSVTRKRLCTGLCIDIGDEEDCNYDVRAPAKSMLRPAGKHIDPDGAFGAVDFSRRGTNRIIAGSQTLPRKSIRFSQPPLQLNGRIIRRSDNILMYAGSRQIDSPQH
jgi:hypothetical protein